VLLKNIQLFKSFIAKSQFINCGNVSSIILFCVSVSGCFGQSKYVNITTISSGIGSSIYLQSIGQSSVVTGTKAVDGYIVRQGFLQPTARFVSQTIENNVPISLDVFPNPFNSQLHLKLSHPSTSPSQIDFFTIDGLRVWSTLIGSNLSEDLHLDFDRLPTGIYLLRLVSGNQVITKQLIKN
jgi:hypothetical protein